MEQILAGLGNRVFLMHNVHEDAPVIFETRWALSYLRGPLTRDQIKVLMVRKRQRQRADRGASDRDRRVCTQPRAGSAAVGQSSRGQTGAAA